MADLNDIPGIAELRELTLGDPGISIALIDGLPDLNHEAFRGRHVRLLDPSGLRQYESRHDEGMREHATFVGSVLVGDPACERPGIAPDCSLTFIVAMHENEDFDTSLASGLASKLLTRCRQAYCELLQRLRHLQDQHLLQSALVVLRLQFQQCGRQ